MLSPQMPSRSNFDNIEDYGDALDNYSCRIEAYELWADMEYDKRVDDQLITEEFAARADVENK